MSGSIISILWFTISRTCIADINLSQSHTYDVRNYIILLLYELLLDIIHTVVHFAYVATIFRVALTLLILFSIRLASLSLYLEHFNL